MPPHGDWTAVSSSWSHTSGHPSASRQNRPTSRVPSHETSPSKPQPARKLFPGSITQNSLPPGSANTTWSSSGSCPTSRWRPPSLNAVSTVCTLVLEGGTGQVEVQAVRCGLLRGGRDEPEPDLRGVARHQGAAGLRDDLSAEQAGPERRQAGRVVGVEAHRHQSQGHARTLETTQELQRTAFVEGRRVRVLYEASTKSTSANTARRPHSRGRRASAMGRRFRRPGSHEPG